MEAIYVAFQMFDDCKTITATIVVWNKLTEGVSFLDRQNGEMLVSKERCCTVQKNLLESKA